MNKVPVLCLAMLCFLTAHAHAQATTYSSVAGGGDWNSAATWDVGVGFPVAGDTAVITDTSTISVTASAAAAETRFEADGVLDIGDGVAFTSAVTTTGWGQGRVSLGDGAALTGEAGADANWLSQVTIVANAQAAVNGNIFASDVMFTGDGRLTIEHGFNISNNVTPGEEGAGTLVSLGNNTISGDAGLAGETPVSLFAVYGGAGEGEGAFTTSFSNSVFAQTVYVTGQGMIEIAGDLLGDVVFQENGTFRMTGDDAIMMGSISTENDLDGIVRFNSSVTLTGNIGASGLAIGEVYAGDDLYAQLDQFYAGTVTTCGAGCRVDLSPGEDSITVRADFRQEEGSDPGMDTLSLTGNVDFAGDIGTEGIPYGEVQFHGGAFEPATVSMTGNIEAYYMWFYDNSGTILNLTDTDIHGSWIGADADDAVINFAGTNTFDGYIGDSDASIAQVNFNSGETTLLSGEEEDDRFWGEAYEWNINNGAAVRLPCGADFYGVVTVNSGGTLDINDKPVTMYEGYVQATGAILELSLQGIGSYGYIDVNSGDTTIDAGSTIIVDVTDDAVITAGDTYQVISVDNIGMGSIAAPTVEDDSADWDFDALANDLGGGAWEILLTAASSDTTDYASQASNPNAEGAGSTLDAVRDAGATGDMQTVLNTLDSLTSDEVDDALNSMLPDASGFSIEGTTQMMDNFLGTQMDHLGGFMNVARLAPGAETGMAAGDEPGKDIVWVQAFGNVAHQDKRGSGDGYRFANGGGAVGVERVFSDSFRTGLAAGSAHGRVRSYDGTSRTGILASQFSWYGGYKEPENPLFLGYALSYAYNVYNGDRDINVGPGDQRVANAEYHGDLYGAMVNAGYGIDIGGLLLTPSASLAYNHLHLARYDETDAGALSLNVGAQDYDRLRAALGFKLETAWKVRCGMLTPEVHVKYLNDMIVEQQQVLSSFAGGGTAFSTQGTKPEREGASLGGSLTLATTRNVTVTLQYDLELREDYDAQTGLLNVAYRF